MLRALWVVVVLSAVSLTACGRDKGLRCEDPGRYEASRSSPPVRVPDDLSVPDESQSLRIPQPQNGPAPGPSPDQSCLESPPDFFDEDDIGE